MLGAWPSGVDGARRRASSSTRADRADTLAEWRFLDRGRAGAADRRRGTSARDQELGGGAGLRPDVLDQGHHRRPRGPRHARPRGRGVPSTCGPIMVHPTTLVVRTPRPGPVPGTIDDSPVELLGEAHGRRGPVVLAWDAVRAEIRSGGRAGRNVVIHEFVHKLDMLDGVIDGTPPLADAGRAGPVGRGLDPASTGPASRGEPDPLLRDYAATDPGEFFAVAAEVFFTRPVELPPPSPSSTRVYRDYFGQDPAARRPGRPSAERRLEVGPQVFDILEPDAHAQEGRVDVGVSGVLLAPLDRGLDAAETGGRHDQPSTASHTGRLPPRRRDTTNDTMAPKPGYRTSATDGWWPSRRTSSRAVAWPRSMRNGRVRRPRRARNASRAPGVAPPISRRWRMRSTIAASVAHGSPSSRSLWPADELGADCASPRRPRLRAAAGRRVWRRWSRPRPGPRPRGRRRRWPGDRRRRGFGIGRRLDPDHVGACSGGDHAGGVGDLDRAHLDRGLGGQTPSPAPARRDTQPVGSTRTFGREGEQDRRRGRQTAGERDGFSALEGADGLLERPPRLGAVGAGVLPAAAEVRGEHDRLVER